MLGSKLSTVIFGGSQHLRLVADDLGGVHAIVKSAGCGDEGFLRDIVPGLRGELAGQGAQG